jgi:hypothetical protein
MPDLANIGWSLPLPAQRVQKGKGRALSEAEHYLQEGIMARPVDLNPLNAWKALAAKYPTLAQMARDIFAIPAAEVGIERSFSAGRDLCSYRRNPMTPATIERSMMVRAFKHNRQYRNSDGQQNIDVASVDKALPAEYCLPPLDSSISITEDSDELEQSLQENEVTGLEDNPVVITDSAEDNFYQDDKDDADNVTPDLPTLDDIVMA